jgi:hypothetical protein
MWNQRVTEGSTPGVGELVTSTRWREEGECCVLQCLNFQRFSQRRHRACNTIDLRNVPEIHQPVDCWGERAILRANSRGVRAADHFVQRSTWLRCSEAAKPVAARASASMEWHRPPIVKIEVQRSLQRILRRRHCLWQGFSWVIASGISGKVTTIHRSPCQASVSPDTQHIALLRYFRPSCLLIPSTRPFFSSLPCIGSTDCFPRRYTFRCEPCRA